MLFLRISQTSTVDDSAHAGVALPGTWVAGRAAWYAQSRHRLGRCCLQFDTPVCLPLLLLPFPPRGHGVTHPVSAFRIVPSNTLTSNLLSGER
ncbi:hypothetical protein ZHAS_00017928 [Anopheles sinensis]|uniref:Uncharacterized protein n=1 Tax=Anopheles sinensis TaxID=74873 RepID=A0A084WI54_ANOSI|nr:hypothetical protein ZHAS_00017928 [Anopheles sinensis]